MTDKDKEKILAEINRLKEENNDYYDSYDRARRSMLEQVEEFVISEPVTNEVNEEILILKDQIESLKAARVATQEVHKIELDNLRKQFLENAKSGVVYDGDYIKFDDRTWIDLDPSLSLKPAFELKEGEKVKVVILKE